MFFFLKDKPSIYISLLHIKKKLPSSVKFSIFFNIVAVERDRIKLTLLLWKGIELLLWEGIELNLENS